MDVALIGLASSGKTSLLQALAAGHLPAHSNPNEPAMAVVKVPDERLDRLATLVAAKKTTYLELKILDFPVVRHRQEGAAAGPARNPGHGRYAGARRPRLQFTRRAPSPRQRRPGARHRRAGPRARLRGPRDRRAPYRAADSRDALARGWSAHQPGARGRPDGPHPPGAGERDARPRHGPHG